VSTRVLRVVSGLAGFTVRFAGAEVAAEWDIEFYADEHGREPCREWMEGLSSQKRLALQEAIALVLAEQGLDAVGTEYAKALGQGLYEFRLRWTAAEVRRKVGRVSDTAAAKSEKILLRVFFCTAGRKIILLLNGYDKGTDDSGKRQEREIARARKLLTAYQESRRRATKSKNRR
jgi:phage-related protein